MNRQTLRIGVIAKPQGVQGELKVQVLSDDPQRFLRLEQALLETPDGMQPADILSVRLQDKMAYVRLSGIDRREQAEALRGHYLCVPREEAIELPPGHHFICDLVGCTVTDTDGQQLGVLQDVLQYGAADVYVVQPESGGKGLMVPALKRLLHTVDPDDRRIVLDAGVLAEVAVWDE